MLAIPSISALDQRFLAEKLSPTLHPWGRTDRVTHEVFFLSESKAAGAGSVCMRELSAGIPDKCSQAVQECCSLQTF